MDYLRPDEFVPFAPSGLGESVNVHHCKEGKGNDRLYIKRTDDGTVIAYCHHCGKRGVSRSRVPRNLHSLRKSIRDECVDEEKRELRLPRDIEKDVSKWPSHARAWPMKYGITKDELESNHISYSERLGRIVLPCFDSEGALTCWQSRKLREGEGLGQNSPKYATYSLDGVKNGEKLFFARRGGDGSTHGYVAGNTVVITEDILSAIKCARFLPSVAALGTHVSDHELLTLIEKYDNIILFLDNDNAKVKAKQKKLKQRLDLLCRGTVRIVRADKDPKEHSNKELREVLNV